MEKTEKKYDIHLGEKISLDIAIKLVKLFPRVYARYIPQKDEVKDLITDVFHFEKSGTHCACSIVLESTIHQHRHPHAYKMPECFVSLVGEICFVSQDARIAKKMRHDFMEFVQKVQWLGLPPAVKEGFYIIKKQ
jgi:hypothetical protein